MMLGAFLAVLLLALALSLISGRGEAGQDPKRFFAARGQFGAVLFFLLSVGETYSIGSVLGFPGGIAASGSIDVALWFVGYILLAFPVGTILYPRLWQLGQRFGAITLPDLLGGYFDSRLVSCVSGCVLVVLMLPLGTMQFIGLGAVFSALALPVSTVVLSSLAALLAFLFVASAGLRGAALTAALKDSLILIAIFCVALGAVFHWSEGAMEPLAAVLHGAGGRPASSCTMIVTTILTQAVGFCIAPQTAAAVFSARSPATIRRAQIWMPLYMVLFPLLAVVAFYGLTHPSVMTHPDRVFLSVAAALLPPWMAGLVAGAVALTALVWLGAVCLSLAAIVTRSIVPHVPPAAQKRMGLGIIIAYLALSVVTAAVQTTLIVTLNRLFYVGLVQLLPAVLLCVCGYRVTPSRLLTGLAAGLVAGAGLFLSGAPMGGVSPALPGLVVNLLVLLQGGRPVRDSVSRANTREGDLRHASSEER
ncbi:MULTISPECIES: sodium:solute symporter family protein [Asaia]|uniref:sodium:solute symporter family protein n=1 Tax=Asaia TaxID=91914 RepID=UPI002FC29568